MATARHSLLYDDTYDGIKVEKMDCVGHVKKRIGKLIEFESQYKGKTGRR